MTNLLLPFEQDTREAALTAKAQADAERAERKAEEERNKDRRRFQRELKAKDRNTTYVALCGISFYTRRKSDHSWWTHCTKCNQPLTYYDTYEEAKPHLRECRP